MKRTKTLRAAMAMVLALMLCVWGLPPAFAASGTYDSLKTQDCVLTLEYAPNREPMAENAFRIWRVGTVGPQGCVPLEQFNQYHVLNGPGTWLAKANTLLGYLQRDGVAPTQTGTTDRDGKIKFDIPAAEQGLYLVAGDSQYRGGTRYTPTPFLIMVPYTEDLATWETNVETYSKFTTYTPGNPDNPDPENPDTPDPGNPEKIQRHVLKSWDDDGNEDQRPREITVDLLRDGQVYSTVTITAANGWRYDWTDLDPQYEWSIVERENDQYAVRVEQEGITFHITNTWQEEFTPENPPLIGTPIDPEPGSPDEPTPITPDDPELDLDDPDVPLSEAPGLPKTGQLWWPVAPMAMGGLALMGLGWKRRRDGSASDEA